MNATAGATADTPARLTSPSSPPPPLSVDITEPLRWAASVANFAGHPDSIEFSSYGRRILVTLRDENLMMTWAQIIGAHPSGHVSDALGTVSWARTRDTARWRVVLSAIVQSGSQE